MRNKEVAYYFVMPFGIYEADESRWPCCLFKGPDVEPGATIAPAKAFMDKYDADLQKAFPKAGYGILHIYKDPDIPIEEDMFYRNGLRD